MSLELKTLWISLDDEKEADQERLGEIINEEREKNLDLGSQLTEHKREANFKLQQIEKLQDQIIHREEDIALLKDEIEEITNENSVKKNQKTKESLQESKQSPIDKTLSLIGDDLGMAN